MELYAVYTSADEAQQMLYTSTEAHNTLKVLPTHDKHDVSSVNVSKKCLVPFKAYLYKVCATGNKIVWQYRCQVSQQFSPSYSWIPDRFTSWTWLFSSR